nr:hypothetical protein [Tanacetum cinerariifolium]
MRTLQAQVLRAWIKSMIGCRSLLRNKTDLEEQSLDNLFNSLKIYEAEVKSSSTTSTSTQNIAFVSSQNTDSTNEPVSTVASAKVPIFALPNVDTLSNAVIYSFFASHSNSPQLNNNDLKQIDADDLEEMDLKWQMAMLTVRARQFILRTRRNLGENRPTSMGFDMSKVECYNFHRKGHFARECRSPKDTRRNVQVEPQKRSVPVETSTSNVLVSQCDGEEQEIDDLKLKLEKFQTSSKNLSQLLASQTNDKTGLGYDNHVFASSMFDCDEMFSFESDVSMLASPINDRYQSGEGYHAVPPPNTRTFMPPKPDLVFHEVSDSKDDSEDELPQYAPSFIYPTEQVKTPRPSVKHVDNSIPAVNHKIAIPMPKTHGNSRNRKACFVCKSLTYLIEDCNYYEKQMVQKPTRNHAQRGNNQHYANMTHPNPTAVRQVTTDVSLNNVIRPRLAKNVGTKPHSPPRRDINRRPFSKPSNFPPKVTTVKAPKVNAVKGVQGNCGNLYHALKDKGVIDSGCLRHMTRNMSYLSNFEEINGKYVSFSGNPKGGKISGKGKIKTGKLDFDDVYFVMELKFNLFSVSQ